MTASMTLGLALVVLSALYSVDAAIKDIPPLPVYQPDYTPNWIQPGDEHVFTPNYNVNNFAGIRDSSYKTDPLKVQQGSGNNGGINFDYGANMAGSNYYLPGTTTVSGGEGVTANKAKFTGVYGLAGNPTTGDVFITDYCIIRRVDAQGVITVYAGSYFDTYRATYYDDIFVQQLGQSCGWNDDAPASQALFSYPYGLAVDATGHVFVADTENLRVRKVDAGTGMVTTMAGHGHGGYNLANGLRAIDCYVGHVTTVAASLNNVYFVPQIGDSEYYGNVWQVSGSTGLVRQVTAASGGGAQLGAFGSVFASRDGVNLYYIESVNTNNKLWGTVVNTNQMETPTLIRGSSNEEYLSVTGDWYGNVYTFMTTTTSTDKVQKKYCSILFWKKDVNAWSTVGGGGLCGPSTLGAPAKETKIMPGYYMYVNQYMDVLWAQHYQEAYSDKTFYNAGVMSLTLAQPTSQPTGQPSTQPTGRPTTQPSTQPTGQPTRRPTGQPSTQPTTQPSAKPTGQPSAKPTGQPSGKPTGQPSGKPTGQPTSKPSGQPSAKPTGQPSRRPTGQPSRKPTGQPSRRPTGQPSSKPSAQPSGRPTSMPSAQPTSIPSSQPSGQPTYQPTNAEITLTRGEITGAVVGAVLGTFFLSIVAYFSVAAYRKAYGVVEEVASSQV